MLRRLLKFWVVSGKGRHYWQGLDSICAPFVWIFFQQEAKAFAAFQAFVEKFRSLYFVVNSRKHLTNQWVEPLSRLLAFHDPELANHLNTIGFVPSLCT